MVWAHTTRLDRCCVKLSICLLAVAGQERQRVKQQLAEANAGSGKPNLEPIFPYFSSIMLDKPSALGGFMEFIVEFMTHL